MANNTVMITKKNSFELNFRNLIIISKNSPYDFWKYLRIIFEFTTVFMVYFYYN